MISQPIKLVDDRQEGAWAQFVAWLVVDNSKIYVRVGGEGDLVANRSGAELKGGREKKKIVVSLKSRSNLSHRSSPLFDHF